MTDFATQGFTVTCHVLTERVLVPAMYCVHYRKVHYLNVMQSSTVKSFDAHVSLFKIKQTPHWADKEEKSTATI